MKNNKKIYQLSEKEIRIKYFKRELILSIILSIGALIISLISLIENKNINVIAVFFLGLGVLAIYFWLYRIRKENKQC